MPAKKEATMTVAEAQALLGVSKVKIAQLIRDGLLHAERDPLDKRSKLVLRAEVEDIRARSHRVPER